MFWKSSAKSPESWYSAFHTCSSKWSKPVIVRYNIDLLRNESVYFDGSISWISKTDDRSEGSILKVASFNINDIVFQVFYLPNNNNDYYWDLYVIDDCLGAVSVTDTGNNWGYFNSWKKEGTSNEWFDWNCHCWVGPFKYNRHFLGFSVGKFLFASPYAKYHDEQLSCSRKIYYVGKDDESHTKTIRGQCNYIFKFDRAIEYCYALSRF